MNPYLAGASPSRAINPPGMSDPKLASRMAGSIRITDLSIVEKPMTWHGGYEPISRPFREQSDAHRARFTGE